MTQRYYTTTNPTVLYFQKRYHHTNHARHKYIKYQEKTIKMRQEIICVLPTILGVFDWGQNLKDMANTVKNMKIPIEVSGIR